MERRIGLPTAKPHRILGDTLNNVPEHFDNHLHKPPALKQIIRRKRKKDAVSANPDLVFACDRSLHLLHIPRSLLSPWKVFDSSPSDTRILFLTTCSDLNPDFCKSIRWCGDGTFKAAPMLWTQLYTISKINRGATFKCSVKEGRSNERTANLVVGYTRATADDFLRGIAYNYIM